VGEVEALMEEWVAGTDGKCSTSRSVLTQDRDRANTYVQVVEFPSDEKAMANSDLPKTRGIVGRSAVGARTSQRTSAESRYPTCARYGY
jgi:hypothetical protein